MTNTIKYSLAALFVLMLLFLYNRNTQESFKLSGESIRNSKKEKWEKFGVDDSLGRHIEIFDKNDNVILHYIFGNSGSDYQHNYVRENMANDVYRTNDNVYFLLNTNPTYWGEKPSKPKPIDDEE